MSSIGFSGIGSGLPIDDIIKATIQAESVPLRRLQAEKEIAQAQISAYGQLGSRLSSLRTAMSDLKGIDKFEQLKATSTNDELFTATANHRTGATAGNYSVEVIKGAENARWTSAATERDKQLEGDFAIKVGDEEIKFKIEDVLDEGKRSMDDLRSYLNREHGDLVSVNLVNVSEDNARLVINSQVSGEAGRLTGVTVGDLDKDASLSTQNTNSWTSAAINSGEQLSGEFAIMIGDKEIKFDIENELSLGQRSLDDLRTYLKDEHGDLFSADLVTEDGKSRLVINSKAAGEAGRISNVPGSALGENTQNLSSSSDALDAMIKIDGIAVSSNTNRFENVISGVTINLAEGVNSLVDPENNETRAASLSVAQDKDAIKNRVDNFLKAYNDLVIHLNEQKKGDLAGESVLRSIEGALRDTLFTPTGDPNDLSNTLSSLGIGTYVERGWNPGDENSSRNGTLEITDTDRFNDILENDMEKLAYIFGDPDDGYAVRFEQLARRLERDSVVDGQNQQGLVSSRVQGLNREIGRIDDRIMTTDRRLELMEQRLYSQFGAVDAMIANINSSGDYLAAQFQNLPGYTRNKR